MEERCRRRRRSRPDGAGFFVWAFSGVPNHLVVGAEPARLDAGVGALFIRTACLSPIPNPLLSLGASILPSWGVAVRMATPEAETWRTSAVCKTRSGRCGSLPSNRAQLATSSFSLGWAPRPRPHPRPRPRPRLRHFVFCTHVEAEHVYVCIASNNSNNINIDIDNDDSIVPSEQTLSSSNGPVRC